MNNKIKLPEIAPLVLEVMPDATREEQIAATKNLRGYLASVYRIFIRLESERNLKSESDKMEERDRVPKQL